MSAELPELDIDAILGDAASERQAGEKRRALSAQAVSIAVTVGWLIYVTGWSHWERVVDNWISALTMVFGSFVAGATPQGGGAVAFPVFTKGLEIPSEVARTFSLCIQMIGMGCASAAILIRRRRIEARVYRIAAPVAVIGFFIGYFLLSDRDLPFAPSVLPGPYVKVSFTLLTAAMAYVTFLGYRIHALQVRPRVTTFSGRYIATITICALIGGLASSQVGSGADVLIYLGLVVLAGVSPSVGVPTSVLVMTTVSIVGFIVVGIFDGQLAIGLDAVGDVISIDGAAVAANGDAARFGAGTALEAQRFDLFGLWIAAVPVVAWGAPLGSWVTSKMSDRRLVGFVVALAAAEVLTTIIFLEPLRNDAQLVVFSIASIIVLFGGLGWLQANRVKILRLDPVAGATTLTRSGLDFGPKYREQLEQQNED
ncbi:MAG: TSUP family transporter [Ilumatobacter sp.]